MPINQPNRAEDPVGKRSDETGAEVPGDECVSLEDVVERLKRVRPEIIFGARQPAPDLAGQSIGGYKILRVVGRGAFGVVYQARDEPLGRDVAIKVPRPEVLFDDEKLRRFESEAATAATLKHPSIIPIYEADLSGPTPYIASAFCDGPNLGEWAANCAGAIPVDQVVRFVNKLAAAVHYAHQKGILHRDLKPNNILLEPSQEAGLDGNQLDHFQPKLTDFGLAKLLQSNQQETRSSIMLGTPRYMAPEQFDKRLGEVGVQSDVYALGVILYELLLGQPIAHGDSHMELLLSILEQKVTPPSRIRSSVSPTLEAICLKVLEKRPLVRYSTALEFSDDLGRYLRGEPTLAKPLSFPSRVAKWMRLNPLAASLLAVVSVSIVGLVLGVAWHNLRLSEQLAVSDRLRIESTESADRLLRANYVSDMQLAQQAIASGRFSEARSRLNKYQPGRDGAKASDFAWHLLYDQLKKTLVDFEFRGPFKSLATSDLLEASVTGGEDGMLRFFDTTSGSQLAIIKAHEGNINSIVFAADGTTLVSGGDDGMLCIWDTSSLRNRKKIELIQSQKSHEGDVLCLALAPNHKWIASGGVDNAVRLWGFEDLQPAGELLGHTDWVRSLDFSPDTTSLVSGSQDGTIRRWDLDTKQEVDQFVGHEKHVLCLKHHPTEPLLVSGGKDRSIRFWDLSTCELRQEMSLFNGWIRSLSISADGNRIAASADDARIMIIERGTDGRHDQFKVTKTAFTNRTKNLGIAFANSDSQVVSAGIAGASVWAIDCNLAGEAIGTIKNDPLCMASLPNENAVVLVNNGGIYTVDLENGTSWHIDAAFHSAVISRDGSLIAAGRNGRSESTQIYLRERRAKNSRLLYHGPGDDYYEGIDISPSGDFVAAATSDHMFRIWQAPAFQQKTITKNPYEIDFQSFFVDNSGTQLILQLSLKHEMIFFDVETAKPLVTLQDVETILNRDSEGQRLAIFRSDYSVTIYDTQQHQTIQTLPSHANEVIAACFSPVEPLLATITTENEIVLWDLDTGEILIRFQTAFIIKRSHETLLAFTSDGRTLVAAGVIADKRAKGVSKVTELRAWRVY